MSAARSEPDSGIEAVLRGLGRRRRFRRGEYLFHAGDDARSFHLVRSGGVRVFQMDEQGREVEVTRLGSGDVLAEAAALAVEAFPASAQAVTDTETLAFDRDDVRALIGRDPRAARFFVELMARKCLALNQRIQALGLRTVRQRLVSYLLDRCGGGGACVVALDVRKGELARILGTGSETLSRTLRRMSEDGLLAVEGRRIRILDCARLRREIEPAF